MENANEIEGTAVTSTQKCIQQAVNGRKNNRGLFIRHQTDTPDTPADARYQRRPAKHQQNTHMEKSKCHVTAAARKKK
jgi:hypothetical protein